MLSTGFRASGRSPSTRSMGCCCRPRRRWSVANRGAWALPVPFEHLGARIYPDMFSLAQAHKAFNGEGGLADEQLQGRFDTNISNFMNSVEAAKHYPCAKRAWVEYLGESPEPAFDRVE